MQSTHGDRLFDRICALRGHKPAGPVWLGVGAMSPVFTSAQEVVNTLRPRDPVLCVRPGVLEQNAQRMIAAFPGDVLYAVKCNAGQPVLDALYAGGVRHFDTATIAEVRQVSDRYADAECHFMHPVKSRDAIAEAYFVHGVRSFVVDHPDELDKILDVTENAADMTVSVRLEIPNRNAMMSLHGKFGATPAEAAALLKSVAASGNRTGLTFHVGSQCVDTAAFAHAIDLCGTVIRQAGVVLDVLDVGGGFPGYYTGEEPEFAAFVAAIVSGCKRIGLPETCRLQCEPGRALVADAVSVIARVELRRGSKLYINDGTYGSLAELKYLGNCFPMQVVRPEDEGQATGPLAGFDLFGPTCDTVDTMPGPFWLADDIREGDWIEIGRLGAYSSALSTRFNGCAAAKWVCVSDDVVLTSTRVASLEELRRRAA